MWPEVMQRLAGLRPRQPTRRQLHVGHDRDRRERAEGAASGSATRRSTPGTSCCKPEIIAQAQGLRRPGARRARGHLPGRAQLPRPQPGLEAAGRPRRRPATRCSASAATSRSSTPRSTSTRSPTATSASRSATRATCCRRRSAPRRRRTASRSPTSIPREGALMWFDSLRDPGRRQERRRGARVHRLHDAPGGRGREHQLRRPTRPATSPRSSWSSPEILNNPGVYPDEATFKRLFTNTAYDDALAARRDAAVDAGEDGPLSALSIAAIAAALPRGQRRPR